MNKAFFQILALLIWVSGAQGAIVFDAATVSTATAEGDSSFSFNHTTCSGGCSNRVAFAAITIESTPTTINNPTYNGVSMGSPIDCITGWGDQVTCIWKLIAPATGTHSFAGSFSDIVGGWQAVIATFSGVDQTTPFDTPPQSYLQAETGDGTGDLTVTSQAGDLVLSLYNLRTDAGQQIPVTVTNTLLVGSDGGGFGRLQSYLSSASGAASVTIGARWDGATYGFQYVNHYALNMNAASAAAPKPRRRPMIIQ